MKSSSRRVISLIVMLLMLFTMLPATAIAAGNEPAVSLEQAIQKVKQNFSIPPEYTEFTSGFSSRQNQQIWSLSWTDKENQKGSLTAEIDAATSVITSMHIYKQGRQTTEIPTISADDAQDMGFSLLLRLIPDRVASLQFVPNQQIIPLNNWEGGQYVLRWQRMANLVPVGDEGVTIQISSTDGNINSYDLNWSNKTIPAKNEFISQQDAAKVFTANEMLELQYLIAPDYRSLPADGKNQPKLVYRMNHSSNGIIDAVSGQPIENQNPIGIYEKGGMGSSDQNMKSSPQAVLSPQEQEEIENTLSLISQEKAAAVVRQWVTLPSNVELEEANLYKDYQDPETRIWNLNWRTDPALQTSYSYISAQVDAVTGQIRSFYVDLGEKNDLKPILDKAGAEKMARDFLLKIQPEKQKSVRLEKNSEQELYTKEASLPNQWSFQFTRLENDIPCPTQGVQISVDSRSKRITSYNLDWPAVEFPDPAKVLGLEKAYEKYLQSQPLTLHYEIIYPQTAVRTETSGEYKLVYSPKAGIPAQQSDRIDALTGEPLNWDGTSVDATPQPRVFTDIARHFAEKEISMLGQAGIMAEYGTAFHPQEQISLVTLLRAMLAAQNGYNVNSKSDEEIVTEAVRNKWLKEELKPDTIMTTALLSQLMIRMLKIEYIAQMPAQALQAPYQDFATMNAELKGYAALTWGLGIIKGDGSKFNASHQTTRGEAAAVLVRTLQTPGV